ncbi:26 kDa periplasmic immunogenic protein precursor [Tsuneonella dongtanensis]|uniref:26 kDa periplasmic immunogenic protein n=1 Tax=Tsuneonella dongtanensis TaxID=692370 RepID=A0A1B2A946_9SPHN|nr:SIMPL domain-containing protein [Tsuneonella dongtanensis]ANY18680.1 26 kDa periplasmic immunogenic protein precursor [Tsuneonella dongtanensis]
MPRSHLIFAAALPLALAACGDAPADPRGVDRGETLLSVSASGHAESRPDKAEFQAGIETWAASATAASAANAKKIAEIVRALEASGVREKDIQTRAVSVQRVDWGPRKGQFQASNVVNVTLRDAAKISEAVTAVTEAGANVVSGPNLSMTDPEKVANLAYADAYKSAKRRAEAYAEAAGMEISRVLYIRDAGGQQGQRYLRSADAMMTIDVEEAAQPRPVAPPPPPPVINTAPRPESGPPRVMLGTTASDVFIQVDFALREK